MANGKQPSPCHGTCDAVVIGSGIGGLTCGAFLAKAGMRVLVLEKHTKIGGYAHTFRRGRYTFESGIHSAPLAEGSIIRHMLHVLGVDELVRPVVLPSTYRFSTPQFGCRLPANGDEAVKALMSDFPGQRRAIGRFMGDLYMFYERLGRPLLRFEEEYADEDTAFVSRYHNRSIGEYIRSFFSDERLREVFYAMWPYAGKNPDRAPTVFYAVMLAIHMVEGSYTLEGGYSTLAAALEQAIRRRGGEVRTRSEVTGVHVRDGQVHGVRLASGECIDARVVVSNVSPYLLHRHLLAPEARKGLWLKRLARLNPSVSCVAAYCGLRESARQLLPDAVTFWFRSLDPHLAPDERLCRTASDMNHLVLLTTEPTTVPATLTLMNFCRKDQSHDWKHDKQVVADAMLAKAESLYPGIVSLVDTWEVGSPETFERFTGNTDGALYGFENDCDIYAEAKLPAATYIKGLYQTGHWGKPGGGIWNVMHNAYRTAKVIERDMQQRQAPRSPSVRGRRPCRLRFIYPRFHKFLTGHDVLRPIVEKHLVGEYTMPPSLALPILAALTPEDIEVALTDDNWGQPIDFDEHVDAVVISCFTPQAARAYEIADEFRRRGTPVLLGGLHPTCRPDEAQQHADAVCVGEGEPVWPQILADLRAGRLKPRYQALEQYDLAALPIPNRAIFSAAQYQWKAHLVLVSRGCPVRCAGCPIPLKEGTTLRFRPYEQVLADIRSMPYREFYITDDTVMLPGKKSTKYLLGLMERTEGMGLSIFLASTMMMVNEPAFYRKLARGGAASMYTVFGFDRMSRRLFSPECTPDEWQTCVDIVRMNQDAGIHFFASFGIGFDDQPPDIAERILRFAHDAGIDLAEFYINTPFPGTPFGIQAEAEGRILHRDYNKWNTGNVVFRPRRMSPEQLLQTYYDLWNEFYRNKEPAATLRSFRDIDHPTRSQPAAAPAVLATPRRKKIKFIYPRFDKFLETYPELAEFPAIAATWAYRMPPSLGIPILVSLLPDGWEWTIQDQNVEPVTFDDDADIVAISFFTPQAGYAYEIGDEMLRRGRTVLMGGMHPSMIPEDCAPHCSAVCIGEAETMFAQVLEDFLAGRLKKFYRAELPAAEQIASPATGVFDVEDTYDWHASLISITRGCPFRCDWCNVPHYQGNRIRLRPLEKVVAEIRALAGKEFYVTDDMVMLNRPAIQRYMMDLCERIREFKVSMFLSCSPAMNTDPAFLDAIAAAGAKSMYTVFASDPMSARFYQRHPGVWRRTLDLVKALEDRGIRFFGSFGLGFDCAGPDQFDLILEFCHKAAVKTAEFFIATPFPNTEFWKCIEKSERFLLPRDWRKYNCANVVFRPRALTEQQLREGFVSLWTQFVQTTDQAEALAVFHQRAENILKSRQYSRQVKEAVARGIARQRTAFNMRKRS